MKAKAKLLVLSLIAFVIAFATGSSSAALASGHGLLKANPAADVIPDRYIVVLDDDVSHPGNVAERHAENRDVQVHSVYRHAFKGYAAEMSSRKAAAVAKDPAVAYVEPDVRVYAASQQTPTGVKRIFASSNAELDIDEKDDRRVKVDVAVIDGAIDAGHSDLNVVKRVDCTGGSGICRDPAECPDESCDGLGLNYQMRIHATHVAGIIGALDNGAGTVGVAPGARIWSVRVLDHSGDLSNYLAGIDYVTAHADQIEVANESLTTISETDEALTKALKASVDAGVVHVAAAGNAGEEVRYLPENDPDVITVSNLEDLDGKPSEGKDRLNPGSNFGKAVDVAAPGTEIYSTLPNNTYGNLTGTSMAAPHVAAAAAILASRHNPENAEDVEKIKKTIEEEGNFNWNDTSGDGVHEPLLDVSDESVFAEGDPEFITEPASSVTAFTATLNTKIVTKEQWTYYGFEYGTSTAYGGEAWGGTVPAGAGTVERSTTIEGLKPNTTYHFRVVGEYFGGWAEGNDMTFTTPPATPLRFDAESFPVIIAGNQSPNHILTLGSVGEVKCATVHMGSEATAAVNTLSLESQYENCMTSNTWKTTVAMNSCRYVFHVAGAFDVACSKEGDAIKILIYKVGSEEVKCTATIGAQSGLQGLKYTSVEEGSKRGLDAGLTLSSLTFTTSGGLLNCGTSNGAHTGGTYTGGVHLLGESKAKAPIGIFKSGNPTVGTYLTGAQSGEEIQQPRIAAESYPVAVGGEQSAKQVLTLGSVGEVECTTVSFAGELAGSTASLPLDADYPSCVTSATWKTAIAMNSCHYVFGVSNSGPPYVGTLGVACSKEGDAIQISIYRVGSEEVKCGVTIGPQSGLSGVGYSTVGAGSERAVETTLNVTTLAYTTTSSLLNCGISKGAHTGGVYSGGMQLFGLQG